jgi:hypothetical protein
MESRHFVIYNSYTYRIVAAGNVSVSHGNATLPFLRTTGFLLSEQMKASRRARLKSFIMAREEE